MDDVNPQMLSYATPTRVARQAIAVWCVAIFGGFVAAVLTWGSAVSAGYLAILVAPACAALASFAAAAVAWHARVRFGLLAAAVQFVSLFGWMVRQGSPMRISIEMIAYVTLVGLVFFAVPALVAAMIVAITTLEPPPEVPRDRR